MVVLPQNIDLSLDLVLTPKSSFTCQRAGKILLWSLTFFLSWSLFTGLRIGYLHWQEQKLAEANETYSKRLTDFERNYYVVDSKELAGRSTRSSSDRISRVYYMLLNLARYKTAGARLTRIKVSQDDLELIGVADDVDGALKATMAIREHLGINSAFKTDLQRLGNEKIKFSLATAGLVTSSKAH